MIPQTVNGLPVRAAYKLETHTGEVSEQYYVIVEDNKGEAPFIVWRVALSDAHAKVDAFWGRYDLTWERASEYFAKQCGLAPEPPSPDVWVATIEHRHGTNTYVRRSELSAREAVEAYVKDWWDRELPDFEMPDGELPDFEMPDDLEARVEEYFERTDESCMITEATIEE